MYPASKNRNRRCCHLSTIIDCLSTWIFESTSSLDRGHVLGARQSGSQGKPWIGLEAKAGAPGPLLVHVAMEPASRQEFPFLREPGLPGLPWFDVCGWEGTHPRVHVSPSWRLFEAGSHTPKDDPAASDWLALLRLACSERHSTCDTALGKHPSF